MILLTSLLFLGVISPLALAQNILIDSIKRLESIDTGITKTFSIVQHEQLQGVSVFGWIRLYSNESFGNIFTLSSQDTKFSKRSKDEHPTNIVFALTFFHRSSPKLMISSNQNNKEEVSHIELSQAEYGDHPWTFVYLGHSYSDSQQTYYKFNIIRPLTIITKTVQQFESQQFYQLQAGIGQFCSKQYFNGDIVRLTIQFGNQAYRENNFQELHVWFPDTKPPCSVAFTQCAYTGETFNLCEGPSQQPIKSILLRDADEQVYVCLDNKQIKIKRSVECILKDNWELLRLEGAIEVESYHDNQCDS